jgi:hypothetical protein
MHELRLLSYSTYVPQVPQTLIVFSWARSSDDFKSTRFQKHKVRARSFPTPG